MRVSVLAITRNGIAIGNRIREIHPDWHVAAPAKLDDGTGLEWYAEPTSQKIAELFGNSDALVCIFSLGAVIRLISPHLKSKKTDPAVLVIDDNVDFVISVLSGHLGGANEIARDMAEELDSVPVITTAADVNQTISVDMVGRKFGWRIADDSAVTRISAHMVNNDPIGVFQDAGRRDWYASLPGNVRLYESIEEMTKSDSRGFLIITDKILYGDFLKDSVVYRPPSLAVGVGLHWDTPKETILEGIASTLERFGLCPESVFALASIRKPQEPQGLTEAGEDLGVAVEYVDSEELSRIRAPNPSDIVKGFEGTASVAEAAAIRASGGSIIVEKQKFPPNLTVAMARRDV